MHILLCIININNTHILLENKVISSNERDGREREEQLSRESAAESG